MSTETEALHPLEVGILLRYEADLFDAERVRRDLQLRPGQANQALSWLASKGYTVESERQTQRIYELTELGRAYAEAGTPEERLLAYLQQNGPARIDALATALQLGHSQVGSAYGLLAKEGAVRLDSDKRVQLTAEPSGRGNATDSVGAVAMVRELLDRARQQDGALHADGLRAAERTIMDSISKKRGAGVASFRQLEHDRVGYRLSDEGRAARAKLQELYKDGAAPSDEKGALESAMLRDGSWRTVHFRPYNVHVPPARVLLGRRNLYGEYLEWVKDKLVALGFEEFDGPLVESEFWNCDALFMPQFHAARDTHDAYIVADPSHTDAIAEPYASRVAATHEDGWQTGSTGWRYDFDPLFTRRLVLRTQGTAVSARTLPHARVPGKYFGILRCFRYDRVDATHLSDFYQTEGIVLGEDVNLRTLLGLLETFALEVAGARRVKYVPGYFPFTEPSVEVHIEHPVLGWFELGGSGIFRPEVTKPLGIEVPVLAWGLGVDRMALMQLGLNDLRELFSHDIEAVRLRRMR